MTSPSRPFLAPWTSLLLALSLSCEGEPPPEPEAGPAAAQDSGSALDEELARPAAGDRRAADRELDRALRASAAIRGDEALAAFEAALEADPSHAEARLQFGLFLLEASAHQNLGRALRQFRLADRLLTTDPRAWCGEGATRAALADSERARPLLERALQQLPSDPGTVRFRAHAELGMARVRQAEEGVEAAEPHFRRAIQLMPGDHEKAWVMAHFAAALDEEDRAEDAERCLRQLLGQVNPTHARSHHQLSRLLMRRGAEDEARRHRRIHELLIALEQPTAAFREDVDGRIAARRELARIYPEYSRGRMDLVREMIELQRYADAAQEVRDLAGSQWTAELFYLHAKCKAGLGHIDAAGEDLRKMRQLAPQAPPELMNDILDEWARRDDVNPGDVQQKRQEWAQG